jgi:hypothetical protein
MPLSCRLVIWFIFCRLHVGSHLRCLQEVKCWFITVAFDLRISVEISSVNCQLIKGISSIGINHLLKVTAPPHTHIFCPLSLCLCLCLSLPPRLPCSCLLDPVVSTYSFFGYGQ